MATGAGIPLSLNFSMGSQLPLDDRTVQPDLASRDAIPAGKRFEGLEVYVISELKKFVLQGGITNADWYEPSGGDIGLPTDGAYDGFSARFGEMFTSTDLEDTLQKILKLQYAAPTISLSTSPSTALREKGTSVASVTATVTTSKRSEDITQIRWYRNAVLINTENSPNPAGQTIGHTDNTAFTDTTSFSADVSDGTSTVVSNTVTYSYVYPYYHGTANPGATAAAVGAMTKSVIASTATLARTFTPSNGHVYYFAYPSSYGALTSILDVNNFETFGDWTLRTENITGLDGTSVTYRIYVFDNPVVAGTTTYTFKR